MTKITMILLSTIALGTSLSASFLDTDSYTNNIKNLKTINVNNTKNYSQNKRIIKIDKSVFNTDTYNKNVDSLIKNNPNYKLVKGLSRLNTISYNQKIQNIKEL